MQDGSHRNVQSLSTKTQAQRNFRKKINLKVNHSSSSRLGFCVIFGKLYTHRMGELESTNYEDTKVQYSEMRNIFQLGMLFRHLAN